jgi:hypothetical protein
MNLKQLAKQRQASLKLRPVPVGLLLELRRKAPCDDYWRLVDILEDPSRIQLTNTRTGQSVELQPDNVREYRSPDFLLLRCQLTMTAARVEIEPIQGAEDPNVDPVPLRDALDQIAKAPLLSRNDVIDSFIGVLVACRGILGSLHAEGPDRVRVGLIVGNDDVFFEVERARYPRLAVLKEGAELRVKGKFAGVTVGVALNDAVLLD